MIFDNQPALRRGVLIGSAISGMPYPVMGRARHERFQLRQFHKVLDSDLLSLTAIRQ